MAASRSTQVESQLKQLADIVATLGSRIESHAMKIAPILRSQPPSSVAENVPKEMLVPVADQIRIQVERIEGLCAALQDLTERSEA